MRVPFLVLLSALSLGVVADASVQTSQTPPTVISGHVLRAGSGEPLKKATVTLRLAAGQDARPGTGNGPFGGAAQQQQQGRQIRNESVTTRDDGAFVFNNVSPGQYRISAERDGYITQEYGQRSLVGSGTVVTLSAGQRLNSVDFQMTPAGTIAGRILDEDGEPMAAVQVQALVYEYRNGRRSMTTRRQVQTNDLGEYRLYWLAPGEYYVSAVPNGRRGQASEDGSYAPSYFPGGIDAERASSVPLPASAEVRGIDFILRPVATVKVRGRVVAPQVAVTPPSTQPAPGGLRGGARGQFLRGAGSPQVVLLRSNGAGAGSGRPFLGGGGGRGNVSADGSFEISNVVPGSYTIVAVQNQENRLLMASSHVDVADSDVGNITLALRPGMEVPGQIYIEGQTSAPPQFKMEQLRIVLNSTEEMPLGNSNAQVNADGSFLLPNVATLGYRVNVAGLPNGGYLLAGRYGGADALNGPLQISDQNVPLQLQIGFSPARVDGTVVDARKQAFPGATCVLVPAARSRNDLYRTATTDQYGKFTFSNVPPGDYKLFAWEESPQGAYQDPSFLGRYEDRGQAVHLDKSGAATFEVRVIPAN